MIRQYAGLVKFAHTIFAMPFALVGFVYALRTEGISSDCSGRYGWVVLLLQVLLCMVFARNAAMGFNRWADRRIDKANPRTADREIPAGKISARAALRFVIVNALRVLLVRAKPSEARPSGLDVEQLKREHAALSPLLDQLRERFGERIAIEYRQREAGAIVIDFTLVA